MNSPIIPVFDLGAVLIDWQPRAMYRSRFPGREAEVEWVLRHAWNHDRNLETDKGRGHHDMAQELAQTHPHAADLIHAYAEHWVEMLVGSIEGTVRILEKLSEQGSPLYAITNWNDVTFHMTKERFPFLSHFDGIIVSGDERLIKPDRAIYDLLCARYGLQARNCFFIDDNAANVEGARQAGMEAHQFTSPEALRAELRARGFSL